MKIAYFDCFSGASGDMIVAALLDAGLKLSVLKCEIAKLKIGGFRIKTRRVSRGMLSAIKFDVETSAKRYDHRTLREIERIIDLSRISARAKSDSKKVFTKLAQAEAKVHRIRPEKIEFHEVGAVDSIVDIVGAAIGFEAIGVDRIYFSTLHLGTGTVECRHGVLPLPAPATMELVKGLPVVQTAVASELTTPTGAAILTALGRCALPPPTRYFAIGHGAGAKNIEDRPNLLRVMIGETCSSTEGDRICVMETNIDDMPSEIFGYVFEKLFDAGALDVYTTPIQMKKNRPAVLLSVIAPAHIVPAIEEVIFNETTTFGIRRYEAERSRLSREEKKVVTPYGSVRVKVGCIDGELKTVAPEYEDCRRAAERMGVPLKTVLRAALDAAKNITRG